MVLNKYILRQPTSYRLEQCYTLSQPSLVLPEKYTLDQSLNNVAIAYGASLQQWFQGGFPKSVDAFWQKQLILTNGSRELQWPKFSSYIEQAQQRMEKDCADFLRQIDQLQQELLRLATQAKTDLPIKQGASKSKNSLPQVKNAINNARTVLSSLYKQAANGIQLSTQQKLLDRAAGKQAAFKAAVSELPVSKQSALAVSVHCFAYCACLYYILPTLKILFAGVHKDGRGARDNLILAKDTVLNKSVFQGNRKGPNLAIMPILDAIKAGTFELTQEQAKKGKNKQSQVTHFSDITAWITKLAQEINSLIDRCQQICAPNQNTSVPHYIYAFILTHKQSTEIAGGDWQTQWENLQANKTQKDFTEQQNTFWSKYFKKGPLKSILANLNIDRIEKLLHKQFAGWSFVQQDNPLIARYAAQQQEQLGDENLLQLGASHPQQFLTFHNMLAKDQLSKKFITQSFLLPKRELWQQKPEIFKQYLAAQNSAIAASKKPWRNGDEAGYLQAFYPNTTDQERFKALHPSLRGVGEVLPRLKKFGVKIQPEKKTYDTAEAFQAALKQAVFETTRLDKTQAAQLARKLWERFTTLKSDEEFTQALPTTITSLLTGEQRNFDNFIKQTTTKTDFVKKTAYHLLGLKTPQQKKAQQATTNTTTNTTTNKT